METAETDRHRRHHRSRRPPRSSPAAPTSSPSSFVLPDTGEQAAARLRTRSAAGAYDDLDPASLADGPERRPAGRGARPAPAGHPPPRRGAAHRRPRGAGGLLAPDGPLHGRRHPPGRAAPRQRRAPRDRPGPHPGDPVVGCRVRRHGAGRRRRRPRARRARVPRRRPRHGAAAAQPRRRRRTGAAGRHGVAGRRPAPALDPPGRPAPLRPRQAARRAHLGHHLLRRARRSPSTCRTSPAAGWSASAPAAGPTRARGSRCTPSSSSPCRWPGRFSPRTGASWEGVGVAPDVECAADEALDRALALLGGA